MLDQLPAEVFGLGGGAAIGYGMRYLANLQRDKHEQRINEIKERREAIGVADASATEAAKRGGNGAAWGGVWVRRFLVVIIAFGVVGAPFYFAAFTDIPIIFQWSENKKGFLSWIFGGEGRQVMHFQEFMGYMFTEDIRASFFSVLGFYLGHGSFKR